MMGDDILQGGSDMGGEGLIGKGDPCDWGGGIEGGVDGSGGERILEEDAGFGGKECGCEVVGMGGETGGQRQFVEGHGAQIGDEAVAAGDDFV